MQKTIDVIVRIKDDPNCFARALKIGGYALVSVEIITGKIFLGSLSNLMANADNLIDTAQVLGDVDCCTSGEIIQNWTDKLYCKVASFASFFAADLMGLSMWLDELQFISLANISAKIATKIPAFEIVSRIGLGTVLRCFVGVGFVFLGLEAQRRINLANRNIGRLQEEIKSIPDSDPSHTSKIILINKIECFKRHAKWERAWAITEVAFKVFALAGGGALFGGLALVGFGAFAAAVGIWAFVYKINHDKQIKGLEKELSIAK